MSDVKAVLMPRRRDAEQQNLRIFRDPGDSAALALIHGNQKRSERVADGVTDCSAYSSGLC